MGTFAGHLDIGIIFILSACWWLWNIWRDVHMTSDHKREYTSRISYTTTFKGKVLPIEILLKIIFPFIAFLAEMIVAGNTFIRDGHFTSLNNLQHMTIYMLFTIHGVVDLLGHYRPKQFDGLRYLTFSIAWLWFGTTFYFHSMPDMGREEVENIIHRLCIPLIMGTGVCAVIECIWRHSVYPQVIRSFCVLTLGTWFTFSAFVLFQPYPFPGGYKNPDWDQSDERNVHFIVVAFGIHLNINLMFIVFSVIILTIIKHFCACAKSKGNYVTEECKYRLLDSAEGVITADDSL